MKSLFEQYTIIAESSWFDPEFYLAQNPDVASSGLDPVMHYLEFGAGESRVPHPDFDVGFYREQCDSLGINFDNPIVHFAKEGKVLGIRAVRAQPGELEVDEEKWMARRVLASGAFDREFYCASYGLNFDSDAAALQHFFTEGCKNGNRPNLYFDPTWYLEKNPDIREASVQPFFHYLVAGDAEGRQPSIIFDPKWYRSKYGLAPEENALMHYLKNSTGCRFSPIPEFNVDFYGSVNKDVRDAGVDGFRHFLFTGYQEGRNPSAEFNLRYYVRRHLGGVTSANPLLHYLEHKHEPGIYGGPPPDEGSIPRSIKQFSKPSADFEEFKPLPPALPRAAKVLAYYLPQFHAFPENDTWWGTGFTEWSNIARGVSRFKGHFQPRIPRDLGFYSLEDAPATFRRQIEFAKGGGIHGFVFYHYWFNTKRLMEKPVEQFLSDTTLDMPFCLMWANENWTRRWDGDDQEVLISQDYKPDDDELLVADFARHFADARYIRIEGRPLLMIYRAGIIPELRKALQRWRAIFRDRFRENPIIVMAQAFGDVDPVVFGFDGAIEFPPHKLTENLPLLNESLEFLDLEFNGQVFKYEDLAERSLNEPVPSYPLIKTLVPGWDNDARRQGSGLVVNGSTPAKYETWLRQLVERARQNPFFGEAFVCVNAWNEWCEAAYLEPDLHYGSAYLNATARAVAVQSTAGSHAKLLMVGHDAFPSGAQHLLLHIARNLKGKHGVQLEFVLLGDGALLKEFRDVAPVTVLTDKALLRTHLAALRNRGFCNAVVNTVAATHVLPLLRDVGIEAVSLVHELPGIIREKHLQQGVRAAFELSRHLVFASKTGLDQLASAFELKPDDRIRIIPQGMYRTLERSENGVRSVRSKLKIKKGEKLVLGMGYADLRKGFDLFLDLWREFNREAVVRIHLCWVGDIDPGLKGKLAAELGDAIKSGTFHVAGYQREVASFLFAADAFALTSREDPFPTVVHEALSAGVPVFAFAATGGIPELLTQHGLGTVVAHCDAVAMARAISGEIERPEPKPLAERRKEFVRTHLNFDRYADRLLRLALPRWIPVSVVIPNFNYARFMEHRLGTVFQQDYPVHEVFVLDDCSSDDSREVIPNVAAKWDRAIELVTNSVNSGSVFSQWRKAAEAATGDFVWIAEADDLSDPSFLSSVVDAMSADSGIVIGFSDSRSINYDGTPLWDSYKSYYAQGGSGALSENSVYSGEEFVQRFLSVQNFILNVSAVVWRRDALLRALEACQRELADFKMAGDWRLYVEVLSHPGARVAYVAAPLNVHRRHSESVTHALNAERHLSEIARCHRSVGEKTGLSIQTMSAQANYLVSVAAQLKGRSKEKNVREVPRRKATVRSSALGSRRR